MNYVRHREEAGSQPYAPARKACLTHGAQEESDLIVKAGGYSVSVAADVEASGRELQSSVWKRETTRKALEASIERLAADAVRLEGDVARLEGDVEYYGAEASRLQMDIERMGAYRHELDVAIKKSEVKKEELRYDIECLDFEKAVAREREARRASRSR